MGDLNPTCCDTLSVFDVRSRIAATRAEIKRIDKRLLVPTGPSEMERYGLHKLRAKLSNDLHSYEDTLDALLTPTSPRPAGNEVRSATISRVPGHYLLVVAEFLYSKRAFAEVLKPTVDDLREEYNHALAEGRPFKARWVRIRGYWSFFNAAGLTSLVSVGKKIVKLWRLVG